MGRIQGSKLSKFSHDTPSNKTHRNWAIIMQSRRSAGAVMFLVTLFILQSASNLAITDTSTIEVIEEENQVERVHFELRDGVFNEAIGTYTYNEMSEERLIQASTIIGTFDEFGLELSRPVSAEWLQPRDDLILVLASTQTNLKEVRMAIGEIPELVIREYLPPSGFVLQGTKSALEQAANLPSIHASHNVPIALILQSELQDILLLEGSETALLGEKMRIDLALLFTWRAIAKMKNSVNTNLLILDEIFDSSLDISGTDDFLKIINTLSDNNVFIISHKTDILIDKFKNVIQVEKHKNFTRIS